MDQLSKLNPNQRNGQIMGRCGPMIQTEPKSGGGWIIGMDQRSKLNPNGAEGTEWIMDSVEKWS